MAFYLETNSLINASRLLETSEVCDVCFVSVHGILELATDLNDEVFGSKQAAMRRILASSVKIDWRQPQKIIFDAFGLKENYGITEHNVRQLMTLMVGAKHKAEFIECIEERGLSSFYRMIEHYDSQYNEYFPKELAKKAEGLEDFLSSNDRKALVSLIEDCNDWTSDSFDRDFRDSMIRVLVQIQAEDLAASQYNSAGMDSYQILASYNNTLYPFLGAVFLYSLPKTSRKERVKRNDFTDLYHLLYVGNSDVLVTDDKLLLKLLQRYHLCSTCTCSEFRKRFETEVGAF